MDDTNSSKKSSTSSSGGTFFDRFGMPIALLVGLIIIAGAIYFGHGLQPNAQQGTATAGGSTGGTQPAPSVNIKNVKIDADTPYIGSANAPVEMAIFFDYQCPFCKQFDSTVLPQLYTNYVQTGKLKIVFKDFDFIGPDSQTASEYGRAVWDLYPNDFYQWFQAAYANQGEENQGADSAANLQKVLATIPGIDVSKVVAEVAANKTKYDTEVQASFQEGQSYGIEGTPSVIVGTTLLQGAQTYQAVSALVDAQLK